jgi:hypothetical protein
VAKLDEDPRPRYGDSHRSYPKPVHNIDPDSDGASENWNKGYREPSHHSDSGTLNERPPQSNQRGASSNRGRGRGRGPYTPRPLYCMYHDNETDHHTKDRPIYYIDTKHKMNQDTTQPLPQLHNKEVNHTMQWAPRNPQHSSLYPSHYPAQTYQNSQTQPSAFYQSYYYATPNHPKPSPAPQMTYHPSLPQITYPTPRNTNANQLKAEPPPPLQ